MRPGYSSAAKKYAEVLQTGPVRKEDKDLTAVYETEVSGIGGKSQLALGRLEDAMVKLASLQYEEISSARKVLVDVDREAEDRLLR